MCTQLQAAIKFAQLLCSCTLASVMHSWELLLISSSSWTYCMPTFVSLATELAESHMACCTSSAVLEGAHMCTSRVMQNWMTD